MKGNRSWVLGSKVYLQDEHRTSNVQHRMMNKKTNVEQRMVIERKR